MAMSILRSGRRVMRATSSAAAAERVGIEQRVVEAGVDGGGADEDAHDQLAVQIRLLPVRQREPAYERTVLGERDVDDGLTRRQLFARDEAHHTPLGIQPHLGDRALAGPGADDRDRPIAEARAVADVVAHAERLPLREQVGAGAPERDEQVRRITRTRRRRLERLAVRRADPDAVADGQSHLLLPVDRLLHALPARELDVDALLTARL